MGYCQLTPYPETPLPISISSKSALGGLPVITYAKLNTC